MEQDAQVAMQIVSSSVQIVSLGAHTVGATVKVAAITLKTMLHGLGAILSGLQKLHHHITTTGKQSLKNLVQSGAPLEQVTVNDRDCKQLVKQLKHYGVDFSVEKTPSGQMRIFVKADNLEVLRHGLEKVIADVARGDIPLDQEQPIQEQQTDRSSQEATQEPTQPKAEQSTEPPTKQKSSPEQQAQASPVKPDNQPTQVAQDNRQYAEYAQRMLAQMKKEDLKEQPRAHFADRLNSATQKAKEINAARAAEIGRNVPHMSKAVQTR